MRRPPCRRDAIELDAEGSSCSQGDGGADPAADAFVLTCAHDDGLPANGRLGTISYRAPTPVDPATLRVSVEAVADDLGPVEAGGALR